MFGYAQKESIILCVKRSDEGSTHLEFGDKSWMFFWRDKWLRREALAHLVIHPIDALKIGEEGG